ncbi:MAG: DUF1848 domain-containing protein [Treponema sp.]|jgi:hypothetical protein|nr:DUF1848 domain-containing protein [Treponema sp.]
MTGPGIISVSRRCDIPRFYFDWFMERLDAGFVDVPNPFNSRQVRHVSLAPEDAGVLVFWTRDPRPILARGKELERRGYAYYVMTTLTAYPALLEPDVPPPETVSAALRDLSEQTGPGRVIWRYDPILLSTITGEDFHLRNFAALAASLEGAVSRVIISLYDEYGGAKRRMAALEAGGGSPQEPEPLFRMLPMYTPEGRALSGVRELLAALARIAARRGMTMQACAEGEDFSSLGIAGGACIDGELIRRLWNIESAGRDRNQRPRCRCVSSVDIGWYGAGPAQEKAAGSAGRSSCPAGCVYCYARR